LTLFREKNNISLLKLSKEFIYELYDYKEKKEYRIDRLMIKDNGDGTGEIYIVDFKTLPMVLLTL